MRSTSSAMLFRGIFLLVFGAHFCLMSAEGTWSSPGRSRSTGRDNAGAIEKDDELQDLPLWFRSSSAERVYRSLGKASLIQIEQGRLTNAQPPTLAPGPLAIDGANPWDLNQGTPQLPSELQQSPTTGSMSSAAIELVVNQLGTGDYSTVQEAVDAVPSQNQQRVVIKISSGTYVEKIYISSDKTFITFSGDEYKPPVLTWNDTESSAGSTYQSASVAIDADHFIAEHIIFENSAPAPPVGASGAQAVALRIAGDMAAFYDCTFLGAQDTLCDWMGRHYFKDCLIQGSIDFIFGNGQSLYEGCTMNSIATTFGSVTAHYRQSNDEPTGYSFINCSIAGSGSILLGRAWGPYSRVVFSHTSMSEVIDPLGWNNWGISSRSGTVYYGEYQNVGAGANLDKRVSYSHELSDSEAAPFLSLSWINGQDWLTPTDSTTKIQRPEKIYSPDVHNSKTVSCAAVLAAKACPIT